MVDVKNNPDMRALAIVDRDEILEIIGKIEIELKSRLHLPNVEDVIKSQLDRIKWKLTKRIFWEEIED